MHWFGSALYTNASLFSKFCQTTYLPKDNIDNSIHHIVGWRRISSDNVGPSSDGSTEKYFRCHIFQEDTNGGAIVFAFRGTLLTDVESLANIWGIACGSSPDFLNDIYAYVDKFLKEKSIDKSRVYLCGHSLGGYIANMLAIIHGFNSVSFDSPGLNPKYACDYSYRYNRGRYKNISFVSHPNFINCFGKQYFDLYYIASNIDRQNMVVQQEVQKEQWMMSLLKSGCDFGLGKIGYPNVLDSAKQFIEFFSGTDLSALLKTSHSQFKLLLRTHGIDELAYEISVDTKIFKVPRDQWFSIGYDVACMDTDWFKHGLVFMEKIDKINNHYNGFINQQSNAINLYTDGKAAKFAFFSVVAVVGGYLAYQWYNSTSPSSQP